VCAQQNGHFPQGVTGLHNGTTLLRPDLVLAANNLVYQLTTKKFLGASYGVAFIIPFVNTRLDADRPEFKYAEP
jgi:hypothetical protein